MLRTPTARDSSKVGVIDASLIANTAILSLSAEANPEKKKPDTPSWRSGFQIWRRLGPFAAKVVSPADEVETSAPQPDRGNANTWCARS
jgi:hypothetical protein